MKRVLLGSLLLLIGCSKTVQDLLTCPKWYVKEDHYWDSNGQLVSTDYMYMIDCKHHEVNTMDTVKGDYEGEHIVRTFLEKSY